MKYQCNKLKRKIKFLCSWSFCKFIKGDTGKLRQWHKYKIELELVKQTWPNCSKGIVKGTIEKK